jgi:hypothetical protein
MTSATSAIEKAANSIYKEISLPKYENIGKYYQLPIEKIDNIIVSCEFYIAHNSLGFRIEFWNTKRINIGNDFISNITPNAKYPVADEVNTKFFIEHVLSEILHYKFNKKTSQFEVPYDDGDINDDIYELFKDKENIKLKIDTCPCCLEPCNWKLAHACGHFICVPCFQKLPSIYDDDCNENKTCPTCRGDCIKYVKNDDDDDDDDDDE